MSFEETWYIPAGLQLLLQACGCLLYALDFISYLCIAATSSCGWLWWQGETQGQAAEGSPCCMPFTGGPMGKVISCPLITSFIYFYQIFPQLYYLQMELHPNGGTAAGV